MLHLVILTTLFAPLIYGANLIVDSASSLAKKIHVSNIVVGLTIVSFGTSAPELVTSIVAARKKNVDLAIGNIVGSNIFNIFFILGISAIINPIIVQPNYNFDFIVNLVGSFLVSLFIFTGKGRQLEKWEGTILVLLYAAYLISIVYK